MASLTDSQLDSLYTYFQIDPADIPYETMRTGIQVELEHGTVHQLTNITNDDLIMTTKIVLAHLWEGKNYYLYLQELESKLEKEKNIPVYFLGKK
jgi:hypothetical protein